jgi:N-glycosylase/DNA lyase
MIAGTQIKIPVRDYDLAATLTSGQAFRWRKIGDAWEGVIGANPQTHWVRLASGENTIIAETAERITDWTWLTHYLQTDLDLDSVLLTFPDDDAMRASVANCRGLRLLRQDPWECLASFILSSTKQIVQIQQIVDLLCTQFGSPLPVPEGHAPVYSFPTAERLALASESELRACKMGFRAPNLSKTATMIVEGDVNLRRLNDLGVEDARAELCRLPGVGNKIANCVLLFAYGFQRAFPIDVWVMKALRQLYFPKRRPKPERLVRFTKTYFGPNAGYAQQYLFHYVRTRPRP